MIYATEQQVVVTAGTVVIVAGISFCLAWWAAYRRGWKHCEENQQWEREQARARVARTCDIIERAVSPEVTHEAWEDQALTLANGSPKPRDWPVDPVWSEKDGRWLCGYGCDAYKGVNPECPMHGHPPDETVLEPTAVLTPEEASWTGEIRRMTAAFEEDMARIMGGTDQQLREITR